MGAEDSEPDASTAGLAWESLFSQYQRTRSLTQSIPWGAKTSIMNKWGRTVSGNVWFIGHKDNVVEIVQEIDDIVNAIFGCALRV